MNHDSVIYYHRACGWAGEPQRIYGTVNECPNCGAKNRLSFVVYDSEIATEAAAAREIAGLPSRMEQ